MVIAEKEMPYEQMNEQTTSFKQTDVGLIPIDWSVEKIKNIASITTGNRNTQDKIDDGLYPFFVRSQVIEKINSFSFDGEAVLTAGDGVGTGKVFHYINGKFDYHQRVYKVSSFQERINGYFFYLYFSNFFLQRITQMTAKSSVDSVRREMIANMSVPLPTLDEQQAIASALRDVDALITSLDALIVKKRAVKKGTMQQLLTGRKRLPGFTRKWEAKTLGEVLERIVGGGTPSRLRKDFWDGDIPWITVKDFATFNSVSSQEYITVDGLKNSASNVIPKGVLITSTRMGLGNAVIYDVDVSINQDLKALFCKKELCTIYLFHWFKFHRLFIESLGSGSTVLGISLNELRKIDFILPDIEEQQAIAKILSDMDAEITALEQKRAKYKTVKQGMMQQLLKGKIRLV